MRSVLLALTDELKRLKTEGVKTVPVSDQSLAALRRLAVRREAGDERSAFADAAAGGPEAGNQRRETADESTDSSVSCELFQPAGVSGRDISLFDDFASKELARQALAWADNTAYTVSMVRRDTSYVCNILDPSGTRSGVSGTSTSSTAQPTVIVRAYAVTARVNWVLVVRSP